MATSKVGKDIAHEARRYARRNRGRFQNHAAVRYPHHDTPENFSWLGRAVAAIDVWNPVKGALASGKCVNFIPSWHKIFIRDIDA